MKKNLFLLPLVAIALAGCGETTCEHVDANKDHKCDKCSQVVSQHADGNKDHLCDTCSTKISEHAWAFSADSKHKCTVCGAEEACADSNSDNKCDVCGHEMAVAPTEFELIASVNCVNFADVVDKTADPIVFSKSDCSFTVGVGTNTRQTIADAVAASKTYEFRVYAYFNVKFSSTTAFSKIVVKSAAPYNGSTYYFDFNNDKNPSLIPNLVSNTLDESTCKSTLVFSKEATELSFDVYHQTRIDTVEFYKAK